MKATMTMLSLLIIQMVSAQEFSGEATYKTHRKVKMQMTANGQKMPQALINKMKSMFQKTYHMKFTSKTSIYQQEKVLQAETDKAIQIISSVTGSNNDVLYKDIKRHQSTEQKEFMGKIFLIKDSLPQYNWELINESKSIGVYTCYKAKSVRTEIHEKVEVNGVSTKDTATVTTIAWYTLQIPVSNGPDRFWGLPGLILEVNEGKWTIMCSEIKLNTDEKIIVAEPDKGKKINQKDFDKLMIKKISELNKRNKNNRKSDDKNNMSIEIEM